jgi:hypothetical protein
MVGERFGEGRIRGGSLAEYTIPVGEPGLIKFDTPFGPIEIRANPEGVRARYA